VQSAITLDVHFASCVLQAATLSLRRSWVAATAGRPATTPASSQGDRQPSARAGSRCGSTCGFVQAALPHACAALSVDLYESCAV
jgi:hypothetical protein